MLDTVRNKLREIYDRLNGKHNTILELFIEQFGEPLVDSDIRTFKELIEWLNSRTLDSFITRYEDRNDYGHYSIDRQDYEANGREKPFLEYIPDLGILDYIIPDIKIFLGVESGSNKAIIVYFPRVRVTNEYDEFIDIQDLYAKVIIKPNGTLAGRFRLNRTTFPYEQFKAGYAHSHMIPISAETAGQWSSPCTGSGPINDTMNTLRGRYDEQFWGLFTFELAKYVTIESIAGTPYIRLEDVGRGDVNESMSYLTSHSLSTIPIEYRYLFGAFARHYASKHKFRFRFVNGQYQIGGNAVSMIVDLSNEFIKFFNDFRLRTANIPTLERLKETHVLQTYIVANNQIYQLASNQRNIESAIRINGKDLFTFKGETVKLRILVSENTIEHSSLLLAKDCCEAIITNVLNIINYQYGKKQIQANQGRGSGSENQANNQASASLSGKPYIF